MGLTVPRCRYFRTQSRLSKHPALSRFGLDEPCQVHHGDGGPDGGPLNNDQANSLPSKRARIHRPFTDTSPIIG